VVRRGAWDAAGGFDPQYFMYGEDLDLSLRLRLAGWDIGLARDAEVEHDYDFDKGPHKWFLLERNRWLTVLGAYPRPLLAALLPALLVAELVFVAVAARGGWLGAKLRAEWAVLRGLPAALRRRAAVQAAATVSAREFAGALTAGLDSPFLGRIARVRPLAAAQAAYWRVVRTALP
jgi:N-acetylglucosaminyl-diphospho-decaprenol L-rhamnosyltransferase